MTAINMDVTIRGPLFSKKIDSVVKRAIIDQSLESIGKKLIGKDERRKRSRKKTLGSKRNIMRRKTNDLTMTVYSTLKNPRTTGKAWTRKNIGAVRGMSRNVLRKTAKQIVGELD